MLETSYWSGRKIVLYDLFSGKFFNLGLLIQKQQTELLEFGFAIGDSSENCHMTSSTSSPNHFKKSPSPSIIQDLKLIINRFKDFTNQCFYQTRRPSFVIAKTTNKTTKRAMFSNNTCASLTTSTIYILASDNVNFWNL